MGIVLICCGLILFSLGILWFALTRLKNSLKQAFLVGGSLLLLAAGLANALVIACNGGQMPAETVPLWSQTPAFLDSERAQKSCLCRFLKRVDEKVALPEDSDVHLDVPLPEIVDGRMVAGGEEPRFAFLDDRHPIRICGQESVYSKSDIMGAIGFVLLSIGSLLHLLGLLWRLLRRRPKTLR